MRDILHMRDCQKWTLAGIAVGYGILIAAAAHQFGFSVRTLINLPVMFLLALSAFIDITRRAVPDWLTLPGLAWVLVASAFLGIPRVLDAVTGALVCGGILFAFALLSRGSIGGGDIKLMAMVGASLGWRWGFVVLLFAQVTAAVAVVALLLAGRSGWKTALPFAPFLATFGLLAICARPM